MTRDQKLDLIIWGIALLLEREDLEMATIQEILDDENVETGDLAQLVDVVKSQQDTIAQQQQVIADLQASQGQLTPEQQAQLDAIKAAQDANDATIKSLLPEPAPAPEPAPEPTPEG